MKIYSSITKAGNRRSIKKLNSSSQKRSFLKKLVGFTNRYKIELILGTVIGTPLGLIGGDYLFNQRQLTPGREIGVLACTVTDEHNQAFLDLQSSLAAGMLKRSDFIERVRELDQGSQIIEYDISRWAFWKRWDFRRDIHNCLLYGPPYKNVEDHKPVIEIPVPIDTFQFHIAQSPVPKNHALPWSKKGLTNTNYL